MLANKGKEFGRAIIKGGFDVIKVLKIIFKKIKFRFVGNVLGC